MISLLFKFFIAMAYGLTLESHCDRVDVDRVKIEKSAIDKKQCLGSKKRLRFNSLEEENQIILESKKESVFFCKSNVDQIILANKKTDKEISRWKAIDHFKELTSLIINAGILKYDLNQSANLNERICGDFPGFFRARLVYPETMSSELKSMKAGGYMLLSDKNSSIMFFDRNLKSVQFTFNFTEEVRISDAIVRKNGDLIVLSYEDYGDKMETCISKFDLAAGNLRKSKCDLKFYSEQVLADDGELKRIYKKDDSLFIEHLNDKFESVKIQEIKNARDFDLNSSNVF